MLSTILKITMTALGLLKSLVQWWREKSIHDAAVNAERARLAEAERKAKDEMDKVDSVNPVDELRKGGF